MLSSKLVAKLQNYFYYNILFNSLCIKYINKKISKYGLIANFRSYYNDLNTVLEEDFLSFICGLENYNYDIPDDYSQNVYYCGGRFARRFFEKNGLHLDMLLIESKIEAAEIDKYIKSGQLKLEEVERLVDFGG